MNFQLKSLDTNKMDTISLVNNTYILNLNAAIKRNNFEETSKQAILNVPTDTLNINNLASLCARLEIRYDSIDCLELVSRVKKSINSIRPDLKLVQNNITYALEEDAKPFKVVHVIEEIDDTSSIIYINRVIRNKLKYLGYMDSQINKLCQQFKDVRDLIPPDILEFVAEENETTLKAYDMIKEIIVC